MMDDPRAFSGFNTSKNSYLKDRFRPTGQPTYPSMALERSNGNSSELKNMDKPELRSKAHVPKLLLTQALQF